MHDGVKIPGIEPVMRVIPMPADMNANGDIFGGWVMAQVDLAGSVPAMRRARGCPVSPGKKGAGLYHKGVF